MATQISEAELAIILRAKAQVDQAFGQLGDQLKKTETSIKLTEKQMASLQAEAKRMNAEVTASQRHMAALHAEALRMNKQFQTSQQRVIGFADAMGRTSTTLARAADTFGLPTKALYALDDAADVAELGLRNLTTATVGFNTATLGVIGVGLALGTAIGKGVRALDDFDNALSRGVQRLALFGFTIKEIDKAIETTWRLLSGAPPPTSLEDAAIAATKAEIAFRQVAITQEKLGLDEIARIRRSIEGQMAMGASIAMVRERYKELPPVIDAWLKGTEKAEQAQKKAGEEAKRAAEKSKQAQEAQAAAVRAAQQAHEDYKDALVDVTLAQIAYQKEIGDGAAIAKANNYGVMLLKRLQLLRLEEEQLRDLVKAWDDYLNSQNALNFGKFIHGFRVMQEFGAGVRDVGDAVGSDFVSSLGAAVEAYGAFGERAAQVKKSIEEGGSSLQKYTLALQAASTAWKSGSILQGAAVGAQAGSMFGPWGAAIGAAAGGLLGFLGKAKRAREELAKMKADFLASVGGIDALRHSAEEAGISLAGLFDARNAKQLSAEIAIIQQQLGLWNDANEKLNEAIGRYGFELSELGPRMSQQRLDEQFGQLYQDWQLLNAAGVDHNAILARMGPNLNEYVNQAVAAGGTIPEAMRGVVDELYAQGKLLHENGEAFTEAEYKGLNYAETLEAGIGRLIDKITQLVNALLGIPTEINTDINVNGPNPKDFTSGGQPLPEFARGGDTDSGLRGGGGSVGGGFPAILHPNETVVPDENIGDFVSAHLGSSDAFQGVVEELRFIRQEIGSRGPSVNVQVNAPVSADLGMTPAFARESVLDDLDRRQARNLGPGGSAHRQLVRTIESVLAAKGVH